jgi:hypothetical protein
MTPQKVQSQSPMAPPHMCHVHRAAPARPLGLAANRSTGYPLDRCALVHGGRSLRGFTATAVSHIQISHRPADIVIVPRHAVTGPHATQYNIRSIARSPRHGPRQSTAQSVCLRAATKEPKSATHTSTQEQLTRTPWVEGVPATDRRRVYATLGLPVVSLGPSCAPTHTPSQLRRPAPSACRISSAAWQPHPQTTHSIQTRPRAVHAYVHIQECFRTRASDLIRPDVQARGGRQDTAGSQAARRSKRHRKAQGFMGIGIDMSDSLTACAPPVSRRAEGYSQRVASTKRCRSSKRYSRRGHSRARRAPAPCLASCRCCVVCWSIACPSPCSLLHSTSRPVCRCLSGSCPVLVFVSKALCAAGSWAARRVS